MNIKKTQIRNSILYICEQVLTAILPVVALPIFTRILTAEDYGFWALAQVYAIFATGLSNAGLLFAFERNFFEENELERRQILFSTIWFSVFFFSFLFGVITFTFSERLAGWIIRDSGQGALLFVAFCATAVSSLNQFGLNWLKNSEQAKIYLFYGVAEKVFSVAVALYLVAGLRIGVLGLVLGQLAGAGLLSVLLALRLLRRPVFDKYMLFECLHIGLPLTPRIFLGVINTQFDKYMIGLMNSVGGVGLYNLGQMIANGVFLFMTAIQNVFSPQVYRRMFELGKDGGAEIGRYLTPFIYISVGVALLIAFFSEEVLRILTPPSYHDARIIIMVLSLYYALLFFGKQPQLIYAKKTHLSSFLGIGAVLLNVGFNIPMIYAFGAIGAAWATLLSGLISGAASFIISQHYYQIKWENRRVLAMYLILAVGVFLLMIPGSTYSVRIFIKLAALLLYGFLGWRIGILTKQHLGLILDQLLRRSLPKHES